MKLFIPPLGTRLKLLQDWKFNLERESRNETLFKVFGIDPARGKYDAAGKYSYNPKYESVTIPAGAELIIDRIYIRKGQTGFDSITFRWAGKRTQKQVVKKKARSFTPMPVQTFHEILSGKLPTTQQLQAAKNNPIEHEYDHVIPAKGVRFWAKLDDVNNMDAEIVKDEETD
jgi:hypothetical protein